MKPADHESAGVGAWRLFFPSALLLAPANVLLWLAARAGLVYAPGIGSAAWHGREMIFGYAFAVIAGFLLQPMRPAALLALWLAWLAGRLLWLVPPERLPVGIALVIQGVFPVLLAVLGARRFAAVKRARNLPFPLILMLLGLTALAAFAAQVGLLPDPDRSPAVLAAYVVVALIVIMGGRLVPTATVGALRAQGVIMRIPTRPRLELATLLAIAGMVAGEGFLAPWAGGVAALAVGALLLVQMRGWHGPRTLVDPEVWPLHAGFAWLAVGSVLIGFDNLGLLALPDAGALHALTAGAIGSVTLAMIIRVSSHRAGLRVMSPALMHVVHIGMALAVALRVAGGWIFPDQRELMLWLSAAGWLFVYGTTAATVIPAAWRAPV
jgi:uncharacterized protein involved in response to NO